MPRPARTRGKVVQAFVVERRVRPSAQVVTGHVRIACEPAGEVVQALAAAGRAGRFDCPSPRSRRCSCLRRSRHRGRNVGHYPMHEITARLVARHAHVGAADRLRHGRHVRIDTPAGTNGCPPAHRSRPGADCGPVRSPRHRGEFAVDRCTVGQAVAAQLHRRVLTLPDNPGAPRSG